MRNDDDESGDPDSELRATFDGLWQRYHAQASELKATQRQSNASWQHYSTTVAAWGMVLMNARAGILEPHWRSVLNPAAHYAAGFPRPTDPALLDADALALYEVASAPPSAWEPNAAGGNWRRALRSWRDAAKDLHRDHFRMKRWLTKSYDTSSSPKAARLNDVLEARALDAIEASYRAGLAAGGDAEDWRGWYRTRIRETWSAADDSVYKLFHSVPRVLAQIDAGQPLVTGADLLNIHEHLPEYWQA